MKSGWQRVKLGEICKIRRGSSPRPIQDYIQDSSKGGMPWVKIADATSSDSRYIYSTHESIKKSGIQHSVLVEPETFILSNSATPGLPRIMKITACVHDGWLVLSDFVGIERDFLYYKCQAIRKFLANQANGSVFQNLKSDIVRDFDIDIPPLPTQRRIAAVLGALDDKIELNRKMNANLEAQAQALFKSWFVDFEPWGGKMPTGWKVGKAHEFFDISIGKTPPRKVQELFSTDKDQNETWVSIADMGNAGVFIDNSSEYLIPSAVKDYNVSVAPKDSVLLSFKLTVGRVCIASQDLTTNEAIAQFKPNKAVPKEYIYLYLKNFNYEKLGSTSSIATAVNSKMIKAMTFVLPPADVLTKFAVTIRPLFDSILNNQHESRKLAELRDTLLPKLMSGELEVAE